MIVQHQNPAYEHPDDKLQIAYKKKKADPLVSKSDPLQSYEMVSYLIDLKKNKGRIFMENKRLYFSIGLFISMLFVVMLFEWKTYDRGDQVDLAVSATNFDELIDIPITEQPPPPPVKKIQQPNIVVATEEEIIEEIEVDFDVEITEESVVEEFDVAEFADYAEEEEVADQIFTIVQTKPVPEGGMAAFYQYVSENIKYPQRALTAQVEGRVFVKFVVNADGSLTKFEVVKGIGAGCDDEALRVLKGAPNWIPGKQRGKPVRVQVIVPIFFVYKEA